MQIDRRQACAVREGARSRAQGRTVFDMPRYARDQCGWSRTGKGQDMRPMR